MSLCTDMFFYKAIKETAEIADEVGTRIYNTAVPVPDEDLDKVPVPYIVISNEGSANMQDTKDCEDEGDEDSDTVIVLVAARSRDELARLATNVRIAIAAKKKAVFRDIDEATGYDFFLHGYSFSAGKVMMDVYKPCVFQALTYACETTNINKS